VSGTSGLRRFGRGASSKIGGHTLVFFGALTEQAGYHFVACDMDQQAASMGFVLQDSGVGHTGAS
jgi:hypothetical protein